MSARPVHSTLRPGLACLALAAMVVAGSLPAVASGPSRPVPPSPSSSGSSFEAVTTTQFRVLEINPELRGLRVLDVRSEEERVVQILPKVPIRAKNKRDFGGRKKLKFEDIAVGQELLITSVLATGEITRVRVRGAS